MLLQGRIGSFWTALASYSGGASKSSAEVHCRFNDDNVEKVEKFKDDDIKLLSHTCDINLNIRCPRNATTVHNKLFRKIIFFRVN